MASDNGDYQFGKIYIWMIGPHSYVGSTCQTLHDRFLCHKSDAKRYVTSKVYKTVRKIGFDELSKRLILIKNYPCNSKDELEMEEQRWIDKLKPDLNEKKAFSYYKQKKFVKIVINCPCGAITSRDHLARHRRTKKHMEYAKKNNINIPEVVRRGKSNCPCGGRFLPGNRRYHKATALHKRYEAVKAVCPVAARAIMPFVPSFCDPVK